MDNLTQIIITIDTVAGSAGIWKFAESRLKIRAEQKKLETANSDGVQYRDDLKARVKKLEDQLDEKEKVEDNLRAEILKLTTELATLRERVLNLEKENERLKTR